MIKLLDCDAAGAHDQAALHARLSLRRLPSRPLRPHPPRRRRAYCAASRAGASSLMEIGIDAAALAQCAETAAQRAELALTPPPAGADELLGLYEAAWEPLS